MPGDLANTKPTPVGSDAAPTRVLVADDDPALLRSVTRALGRTGYAVTAVEDGVQAMTALGAQPFEVIVSDVRMPGMTGTDLLRQVRAVDADVPVVLLTGAPSLETAIEAVELGAFRYLTKPVDTEVLREAVASASRVKRLSHLKRAARELLGRPSAPFDPVGLDLCLSRALGSLWLACQPLIDTRTQQVFAYEALMRTSEVTLPHPGAILEAAERLGRLPDVSQAVLERAAQTLCDGSPPTTLFVNLHPQDLRDERLFDADASLASVADRIVLEVTERDSLDKIDDLRSRVQRLRRLGFRIAIDDLGAGYASLNAFVDLEPDFVKIDMGLIRGIDASPARHRVVGSLTELCHDLGVTVVAEGVETAAERDALVALNCDLLQGYWFARPGLGFPRALWDGQDQGLPASTATDSEV